MTLTKEERFYAALRADFSFFVRKVFSTLHGKADFIDGWHLDAIVYRVRQLIEGDDKRLVVNMMPRSLKSIIFSVALPAYLLGHNPAVKIICASYADDLAEQLARSTLRILESAWYRRAFPAFQFDRRKKSAGEIATTMGGFRLATSVGGPLTGRGGDWIIIDDPMKALDAYSAAARRQVINWYRNTVSSRLDRQSEGRLLVVMQRLHQEDLAGHLIEAGWPSLVLSAEAKEDTVVPIGRRRNGTIITHSWKAGELLCPALRSKPELEQLRLETSSLDFAAQYMQAPVPPEGNLFKREWIRHYELSTLPPGGVVIQVWDCASKVTKSADYSVGTTWRLLDGEAYLLEVIRGRWEFPELVDRVKFAAAQCDPAAVLIEDADSGRALLQVLEREGGLPVVAQKPTLEKYERAMKASISFERRKVFFPSEAPWLADLLEELLAFPNGRYDDQVDSVVYALLWLEERALHAGVLPWAEPKDEEDCWIRDGHWLNDPAA